MKYSSSADQSLVREINLSLVLRHIHCEAPISRAQIAHDIRLNKSTVSSLVESLIDRNLVHETGKNSTGAGRPARLLEINPRAGGIIGILFGVDFISVALTDFSGRVLWRMDEDTNYQDAQEKILDRTGELVQQAVDFSQKQKLVLSGLGAAVPGIINLAQGNVVFAPNLHWHDVPLQAFLAQKTSLPVYLENDANAAAVA